MTEAALGVSDMLVVLPVALSILFAAVLAMLRGRGEWHPPLAAIGLAVVFAVDLALLHRVFADGTQVMLMGAWAAPFGIVFALDRLGAVFLAAAGLASLACGLYAAGSVPAGERRHGFFPLLFLLSGGVSGAFLTGDIFNLYVWFELLLLASFGLLILGSRPAQLDGALKYCVLNLLGTTVFLINTGYLYGLYGTLNMADIARAVAAAPGDGAGLVVAALYLFAFLMKAAAFPLNAWLPASYHTPRFVVSALFAGLLTKVGVYAAMRVNLMLFPAETGRMAAVLAWVAGSTMIVGALGALAQSDLRRLLNYVVVAGIGTVLAGIAVAAGGSGGTAGAAGAVAYALHSILVMTALYLGAGIAATRAGSASLHEMGGLWAGFPAFSGLMLALLLSAAGLPPLSGFWGKLMLVDAAVASGRPWLAAAILVSGFLLTIAAARVFALAFWRAAPAGAPAAGVAGEGAPGLLPVAALALLSLGVGLLPEPLIAAARAAAADVGDVAPYIRSVLGSAAP